MNHQHLTARAGLFISYGMIIAAIVYYLLNIWIISPAGDFPINDDLVYGRAVQSFLESGKITLVGSVATCYLHVLIGGLVTKFTGFSYEALRQITLLSGLLTVLGMYLFAREIGIKRPIAGLVAFVVAANPLFVNLCFAFMTDVPALMFTTFYMWLFVKGLRTDSKLCYLLSACSLVCAIAVRQWAAVFALANAAALFAGRKQWWLWVTLVVFPLGICGVLESTMASARTDWNGRAYYLSELQEEPLRLAELGIVAVQVCLNKFAELASYLGIFCAPLAGVILARLCISPALRRQVWPWLAVFGLMMAVGLADFLFLQGRLIPYQHNLWDIPALGVDKLIGAKEDRLDPLFKLVLSLLGGVLGVVLVGVAGRVCVNAVSRAVHMRTARSLETLHYLFVSSCFVLSMGLVFLLIIVRDFDRYYLMAFIPALAMLALALQKMNIRPVWSVSLTSLAILAASSTLAEQECMNWNRVRWQALEKLEAQGISAKQIDGGLEYNASHGGSLIYAFNSGFSVPIEYKGSAPQNELRWWPIHGEEYIVSFLPLPGYDVVERHSYWSGLSMCTRDLLVLKRKNAVVVR